MEVYDILVAGAGPSGLMAALAAAREGARVLLIEQNGIPGGMNTAAMVGPLMGFHAGKRQVVRGLAQQVIDRLARQNGTLGHLPDPLGVASTITPFEPTILKQVYFQMLREAPNITLLLHSTLCAAEQQQGQILHASTLGKEGLRRHTAHTYIDATGDGDLAALAGVPFAVGRAGDGLSQPMTLVFKLGGINFDKVRAFVKAHPAQFVLGRDGAAMPYVAISGYFDAVAEAKRTGELTLDRDRVLLFEGVRPDEALVNMTRVVRKSGLSAADLTAAEQEARAQTDEILRFLTAHIDGFQTCRLVESGDCIGVRESRHIRGQYTLTEKDVLSRACFDDSVAVCAFPIDIHDPTGQGLAWVPWQDGDCYDVPYRVMLPQGISNLLVTGRCVSATHEAAASVRITPTAMALGEAAGIAAAMAAAARQPAGQVGVPALQASIARHGGVWGQKRFDNLLYSQ